MVNYLNLVLSLFTLLAGTVASISVLLNDYLFWSQAYQYINPYLFAFSFLMALSRAILGLMACIFLIPLSAGLGSQINVYFDTNLLILPNAGLDLAAGFFLGFLISNLPKIWCGFQIGHNFLNFKKHLEHIVPWPLALVIVMVTISTAVAITRNVYQSAAATSFKGLVFNLIYFRPIGWHDDYMPISDWIAYALAVAMTLIIVSYLKEQVNRNKIIFRPILASLVVAVLMGLAQSFTGLGLPESLQSFRKDLLGYAAIGFQPDIHAFAGHMLLGAIGLWGYFFSGISRFEKKFVVLVISLSWLGLILSKSRALFLIALVAMFFSLFWYLWKNKRSTFLPAGVVVIVFFSLSIVLIFNYSNNFGSIPVLSWLGGLANEFKSRDLTSWSLFSGIFSSRFEIWEAAIRMWWEFPLMGIGQGSFYRLSEIASFSKSHFLILNHGENAHNYFLQTLTETGIIGASIFLISILMPMYTIKNKKIILPTCFAIVSLLLGNIFSHSFLVRENLILLSVMLGLSYTYLYSQHKEENTGKVLKVPIRKKHLGYITIFYVTILILSIHEIGQSISKFPFQYGIFCNRSPKTYDDGWTNGIFIFGLPRGAIGFSLVIKDFLPQQEKSDIRVKLETLNSKHFLFSVKDFQFRSNQELTFYVNDMHPISEDNVRVLLSLPFCVSPRNIGLSSDSRRLGFLINTPIKILYE
jgi:O-antigen ligase